MRARTSRPVGTASFNTLEEGDKLWGELRGDVRGRQQRRKKQGLGWLLWKSRIEKVPERAVSGDKCWRTGHWKDLKVWFQESELRPCQEIKMYGISSICVGAINILRLLSIDLLYMLQIVFKAHHVPFHLHMVFLMVLKFWIFDYQSFPLLFLPFLCHSLIRELAVLQPQPPE